MAFNFNNINQAMGQTNIFDPESPMTQGGTAQANVFQTSGPSAAAPASPSGGVQSVNPGAKANVGFAPNQAAKAYSGVQGTDSSKATTAIQQNIQGAQQKLQDKANTYAGTTETAKAGNALGTDVVGQAANGDDKSFQTVAQRLAQTGAKQVDRFQGLKDEELPALTAPLQSASTYGEIFRPQAGANYTAGQSNLEDMFLGRNSGFRQLASGLKNDEEAFIKKNDESADTETKKAQDILQADWQTQTDKIRNQLTGESTGVIDALKQREVAEEARRAGLDPKAILADEFAKEKKLQAAELSSSGLDSWTGLLDQDLYGDQKDYLKMNTDVDYNDLVTQDEADKYNRINSLLGNSSKVLTKGQGAAPDYTYDTNGASSYIKTILSGKAQANTRANEAAAAQQVEQAKIEAQQRYQEQQTAALQQAKLQAQIDSELARKDQMDQQIANDAAYPGREANKGRRPY